MSEQETYNRRAEVMLTLIMVFMMSVNSLGTCILASFVNASWEDLGPAKKVLLFVAIITNWTQMIIAFLNRNFARLMAGKPPVSNGNGGGFDTQQFQKQVSSAPTPAQK